MSHSRNENEIEMSKKLNSIFACTKWKRKKTNNQTSQCEPNEMKNSRKKFCTFSNHNQKGKKLFANISRKRRIICINFAHYIKLEPKSKQQTQIENER